MTQPEETIDSILMDLCAEIAEDVRRNNPSYDWKQEHRLTAKARLNSLIEGILDNIENSVKQHTVPEGRHLVTRSYVLNTLEFERKRLKQLGGN
jgi:hypothetical protein